jgi:hypothetical protein
MLGTTVMAMLEHHFVDLALPLPALELCRHTYFSKKHLVAWRVATNSVSGRVALSPSNAQNMLI